MNQRQWITSVVFSTILFIVTFTVTSCEDYSISQISPKSIDYNYDHENIQPSMAVDFEKDHQHDSEIVNHRVVRSASPILNSNNDANSLRNPNHASFNDLASSARHFNTINPTLVGNGNDKDRMGKSLHDEGTFFGERGRRAKSSRPQELTQQNTVSPKETTATTQPSNPRQNNGNINDIITGIVNLLNGNVNVHSNAGGANRPKIDRRINNRGPPRISEAQVPGQEQEQPKVPTRETPPFPFERPDGPVRPFLTGVPLPEQIVPSMQQNYNRPGFVSQNRPPWKRPKPRPPINTNRRPIPPYKNPPPIPALPEYVNTKIEEDQLFNQGTFDEILDRPTNESDNILDLESDDSVNQETENPYHGNEDSNKISPDRDQISPSITTIMQTTSEVNTIQNYESNEKTAEDSDSIVSSMSDVNERVTSTAKTPELIESSKIEEAMSSIITSQIATTPSTIVENIQPTSFVARPGLVLDDPEFKPGHKNNYNNNVKSPAVDGRPPGYGEIFDITLSAIQGPNGNTGSQQTVNIRPFGQFEGTDIIFSPSGDQAFVSIDGKRSYINLFGESSSTEQPSISITPTAARPQIKPTNVVTPGITGSGYVVAETEPTVVKKQPSSHYSQNQPNRPVIHRPRFPAQQQPVRIDTCIVGDDSTCDQAQERCRMENGISSCNCRPGYARRKHRDSCRKVVSIVVSIRVDKIYERKVVWDRQLANHNSEPYQHLSYESLKAIDSAMSMTPFSDEFMEGRVNNIYQGDASQGMAGVFVNLTLMIDENKETLNPALKGDIQRHLLGVILRRNNNIGNSALYVESPPGSISAVQDFDECISPDNNDCHPEASCTNIWGSFRCECNSGFRDLYTDQPNRAGRQCLTCSDSFCNNRGSCSFTASGNQACACKGSYYGSTCEIDGEVLFVAIGASVAAIIIIILTLVCLIMWSRKWQREHKNAIIGSPVFGYLGGGQVKTPTMGSAPYQVTLEDRMRWAQIADVMAQSNHNIYAPDPHQPTRPSSAIFHAYPTLATISGMHTLGAMSMGGMTMRTHATLPPVPLPRLGLSRPSGMRTLENSSSSEEEDRTDLLGRGFHVPRPKSRSNASVNSGIYYDVDYQPPGEHHLYGTSNHGIQMTTYTPSTTYYK